MEISSTRLYSNCSISVHQNKYGAGYWSYCVVSYFFLIAKTDNSHSIGEDLVLPAAKEVIETVMHQSATSVSTVLLNNDIA